MIRGYFDGVERVEYLELKGKNLKIVLGLLRNFQWGSGEVFDNEHLSARLTVNIKIEVLPP